MSLVWNLTIDDTSPFLIYTPYGALSFLEKLGAGAEWPETADGSGSGLANGWIPWYSISGFISSHGDGGAGTSYHRTSLNGAAIAFAFHGTGVHLYGDINNSSYTVKIDGETSSFSPSGSDLLYSASGLEEGTHSVSIMARPSGSEQFVFDYAVISTPLDESPFELFYDNTDQSVLTYTGAWSPHNAPGVPNATVSHVWQQTVDQGASVSMQISDAVGVAIHGMTDWGGWLYDVTVDETTTTTFNGSTFWQVPDALLFYQGGLDPAQSHTVTLRNPNNDPDLKLNLNSFRVFTTTSSTASVSIIASGEPNSATVSTDGANSSDATTRSVTSATSTFDWFGSDAKTVSASSTVTLSPNASASATSSEIKHASFNVGLVLGPVIAVAILAIAAWLFWRRRRRSSFTPNDAGFALPSHHSILRRAIPRRALWVPTPYRTDDTTIDEGVQNRKTRFSSVSPPSEAPPTPGLDSHNVDRLVELIAQRIDSSAARNETGAPPEYRSQSSA
ncbi:TPR-REGION domain-containing protein [Mycena chlorophos]|uniref:TPR-REGION domain-containing protein n=1 Tax=Mycena chlorophos TaxID=658473 RepID=A0A8H6SQP0_MYCCL|nr:TPR-REGION domain-containing protein [Mycena chlorophos]